MSKVSEFELHGACCANGIIRAKKAVKGVAGTGRVTIDLTRNVARVEGEAAPESIVEALQDANFTAAYLGSTDTR